MVNKGLVILLVELNSQQILECLTEYKHSPGRIYGQHQWTRKRLFRNTFSDKITLSKQIEMHLKD